MWNLSRITLTIKSACARSFIRPDLYNKSALRSPSYSEQAASCTWLILARLAAFLTSCSFTVFFFIENVYFQQKFEHFWFWITWDIKNKLKTSLIQGHIHCIYEVIIWSTKKPFRNAYEKCFASEVPVIFLRGVIDPDGPWENGQNFC